MSLALTATLITSLCLAQAPSATAPPAAQSAQATAADTAPQVTEGIVNAPVSELWNIFSTNEGFKKLGVAKAEIDFRVGGLMRSHYSPTGVIGDEGTIQNEIISFEPQRMISFRIHQPPKGFPFTEAWKHTWSVVTFTDLGDNRTQLRLTGVGYDSSEESQKMRDFFRAGNAYVMKNLQARYDTAAQPQAGPAHPAEPLDSIELDQLVAAPRAEVFKWYTTADGWKAFFGAEANIKLMPGGPFEIRFNPAAPKGEGGSEGCNVLSYIPNQMLSYTWNAPPAQTYCRTKRSWVVITFDEVNPTLTRVHISHQGFAQNNAEEPGHEPAWATARAYFAKAWPHVLDALAKHAQKS